MNGRWTSKVVGAVAALALTLPMTLLTSGSAVATTPPAAPIDVVVTDVGWQQVTVEWEHGSSDTPWMYRIDNLTTGDVWTASGTSTSSQVRSLQPEQTYQLQLKAIDVYSSSEPVELTVTTVAMPHVDPASDLEVVDVVWNGADLAWKPSQDDDLWSYEVVDLDSDRITAVVSADTTSAHLKLLPERTYRFVVQAARVPVDGQQVHSELTNEVTITTPEQTIEPPHNLQADLDGRGVTLTWQRPEVLDFPTAEVEYLVFDGDELETVVRDRADSLGQFIPRVTSGEPEFTVRIRNRHPTLHGFAVSEPSNAAVVDGPPSDDTTPPVPPNRLRVIVDCSNGDESYELLGATDDTSPLNAIRYQAIRFDTRTGRHFVDPAGYDVPRTGSLQSPLFVLGHRITLRAVDEAGNRSEIVELFRGEEEFVNC
jgi:hypothetical protein